MSDVPEKVAIDLTQLATYTNKISELASISKMMAPVFIRDMILGQDVAATLLAIAIQADSRAKAHLEYTESIAYLEKAKAYLDAKSIKDSSEARKQYVDIDTEVLQAKDNYGRTEALVLLLKSKLSELRQSHDDCKKFNYGDTNMTNWEGM